MPDYFVSANGDNTDGLTFNKAKNSIYDGITLLLAGAVGSRLFVHYTTQTDYSTASGDLTWTEGTLASPAYVISVDEDSASKALTNGDSFTYTPLSPTSASTGFFLDASGSFELRLCVTDDEGEVACCTVTINSTPPGVLQVEIAWDEPHGDVDLHLLNVSRTPPDGWWTADDCHYANPAPDWGPGGAAANPTLDRDDRDGFGPENISIDTAPASGTYNIGLHYFCDRTAGGSGATDATVRVICMGSLIATYTGITMSETDDWVNVARVTWPGCVGMSVNTRTNGSSLLPAGFTSARHCEISCATNADCPDREQCRTVVGMGGPRLACVLAP